MTAHKVDEVWRPGVRGYHEATGAIILAKDTGRLLLQLRSPKSHCPNTYGQFGGSIDGNEQVTSALLREIKEETGYTGTIKLRPLMVSRDPARSFVYYNYLGVVPKEFEPQINEESGGYKWFNYGHWPSPLHPGLQNLIQDRPSMQTVEYFLRKCNVQD
jgi:8-oxo-dGTP pyrophosphatase MutT (NUDIX family)